MAHAVPGPAGPPPLGPAGFDWTAWNADPVVVAGLAIMGAAYAVAAIRRRKTHPDDVRPAQCVSFFAGLTVLFGSLTGPVHDLSDYYLFSAHMVQHLLLAFAMPPLLLYGTPAFMLRPLVRDPRVLRLARWLTRPSSAFAVFNLVLVAWHLPPAYNLAMEVHPIHIVQHLMIMAASVVLWWPVLSPLPEVPRAAYPVQLLYLFVVGLPMVVVSIFITMADHILYPYYAAAPRVFPALGAQGDQHFGGLIMWIPGGFVFLVAISVVFFRWQAAGGEDVAPPLPPPALHAGTGRARP